MANTNKEQLRDFLYIEGADNPLKRVANPEILKNIIDPTTGHAYNGIVLEGEFASLDVLNNNNRTYDEANYLEFIASLKLQIHSKKGIYGHLEHPKGYATDYNEASHKLLDIWYDKSKKKVFGIVLLLNTPKGLIAQEIIRTGGQLGISARGGGSEIKNNDGTISAKLKLLVTFDLVNHPGFTSAVLDFTNLNESEKIDIYKPSSIVIYDNEIDKIDELYESYLSSESPNFISFLNENKLFESQQEFVDEQNQEKLEDGEGNNQEQQEKQLSDAVDENLSESQKIFYNQMMNAQAGLTKKIKQGNSYFDNSAGFVNTSEKQKR